MERKETLIFNPKTLPTLNSLSRNACKLLIYILSNYNENFEIELGYEMLKVVSENYGTQRTTMRNIIESQIIIPTFKTGTYRLNPEFIERKC